MGIHDLVSSLQCVSTLLITRFVIEMQKIPARRDNMPPDLVDTTISENTDATLEGKKDK